LNQSFFKNFVLRTSLLLAYFRQKKIALNSFFCTIRHEFLFGLLAFIEKSLFTKNRKAEKQGTTI